MASEKQDIILKGHRQGSMLERLKVMQNLADPIIENKKSKIIEEIMQNISQSTGRSHSPRGNSTLQHDTLVENTSNQSYPMNNDPMDIDAQIQRFESKSKLLAGLNQGKTKSNRFKKLHKEVSRLELKLHAPEAKSMLLL